MPCSEEPLITCLDDAAMPNHCFQRLSSSTLMFILFQTCTKESKDQHQLVDHTLSSTELMETIDIQDAVDM